MVQAEVAVPEFKSLVTDLTNTLTTPQIEQLNQKLTQFEQQKGSQIAILIVPTTEPEEIEQFSIRVVENWKLGRKKIDDGVLLLIAKDDRAVRIEVSYGLEGAIPDALANRITDEFMAPLFKQGDYFSGIDVGIQKLIDLIQGEPLPEPNQAIDEQSGDEQSWMSLLIVLVLFVGSILRATFGRIVGAGIAGGLAGVAGMVLGGMAMGFVAGLIAFVFVASNLRGGRFGGGGGFGGGGFKGGGGGRFGGGGATGRW